MISQSILFYCFVILVLGICFYMYFIDKDKLELKCVVSGVDGNTYCVRDRTKVKEAADLLAKVTVNCKKLVEYVGNKYPEKEEVIQLETILENIRQAEGKKDWASSYLQARILGASKLKD